MQSYQDLKSMTKKELLVELSVARVTLQKQRITVKTKHDKDTSAVTKQKRYVARLLTALKEIELEEMIETSNQID